jgi:hypothetical protein
LWAFLEEDQLGQLQRRADIATGRIGVEFVDRRRDLLLGRGAGHLERVGREEFVGADLPGNVDERLVDQTLGDRTEGDPRFPIHHQFGRCLWHRFPAEDRELRKRTIPVRLQSW